MMLMFTFTMMATNQSMSNFLSQGGGWCNDIESCLDRAKTRRGSTRLMSKWEVFSGILSNNASLNPGTTTWLFFNPVVTLKH